jgi:hypothetical protein
MHEMKKFYYDTAGTANPGAMASLLKLVTPANVLFGTDFPPGGTSRDVPRRLPSSVSALPTPICARSIATTRCGCCRGWRRADEESYTGHASSR